MLPEDPEPEYVATLNPASVLAETWAGIVPSLLATAASPAFQHQATESPAGATYAVSPPAAGYVDYANHNGHFIGTSWSMANVHAF